MLFVGSNLKKLDVSVRAAACGTASGMKLATARQERGVKARVRGGLAMCIFDIGIFGVRGGSPANFFLGLRLCGTHFFVTMLMCHV